MTSPYQEGDDAVLSNFDIDVSFRQDSVRSLEEVAQLLSQARVQAEALSRSSGDVVQHLREAAVTDPIKLTDQADVGMSYGGQPSGGSQQSGGGQPSGGSQQSGGGSGPPLPPPSGPSGTTATPSDPPPPPGEQVPDPRPKLTTESIEEKLKDLNEEDPERVENMKAAREQLGQRNKKEDTLSQGVEGFSRLAQNILSETRPGASLSQTAASVAGGLGDLGSSGLGGVLGARGLGALGLLGGGLTAGVALNAAIQSGGQQIQQYANMGAVQGGGASEGFGYEMQIRQMAMNPFLTSEQSRQIVMSALNQGFSGQEFDTVTDFMATNLKDMNMQVSESTTILRKSVLEGGQSIQQLSLDLGLLKNSTQGGVLSLEQRTQLYQQASGSLIDLGVSGDSASAQALTSLEVFEDDHVLSGMFTGILANPSDTLIRQAGRMAGMTGTTYQLRQQLGESGEMSEHIYSALRVYAVQLNESSNTEEKKRELFNRRMTNVLGQAITPNQSDTLYEKLLANPNAIGEAGDSFDEETFGVRDSTGGGLEGRVNEAGSVAAVAGQGIFDTLSMLDFGFGEDETLWSNFSEAYKSTGDAFQRYSNISFRNKSESSVPIMDELIELHGATNISLINEEGKIEQMTRGLSKEQADKLSDGSYRVSINKGDPVTLQEARGQLDSPTGEGGVLNGQTNVAVEVGATDELRRLLKFDTRTQNQEQADSGYGAATRNAPPPGDR